MRNTNSRLDKIEDAVAMNARIQANKNRAFIPGVLCMFADDTLSDTVLDYAAETGRGPSQIIYGAVRPIGTIVADNLRPFLIPADPRNAPDVQVMES